MKPKNRVVKVKFVETGENPTNNDRKKSVTSGFDKTVFEFLQNYEPSSSSRKPLWCRVCKFQGGTLNEFNEHMVSSTHQEASQIEREVSYCSLCRKQFTSPEQMKEHLIGKAHKEKLERYKRNSRR
jgi:hypothetical protein